MKKTNYDKPDTDKPTPNYFVSIRKAMDELQRRFADNLSSHFNRLSPRTRKTVLISMGLAIALLCFQLVFAPADLKFSFGEIRSVITEKLLIDSVKAKKGTTNLP